MQESAQAALSWVRSHGGLGVPPTWFSEHDIHIHVPAGAVPKDGPSAGVTMATAIASLVRGTPVSDEVGMTGEITLTGQVLPIGGLREKVLAAQRAGLKRVILPRENEVDLEDLPAETRRELEFVLVDSIEQVLEVAFDPSAEERRPKKRRPEQRNPQQQQRLQEAQTSTHGSSATRGNRSRMPTCVLGWPKQASTAISGNSSGPTSSRTKKALKPYRLTPTRR